MCVCEGMGVGGWGEVTTEEGGSCLLGIMLFLCVCAFFLCFFNVLFSFFLITAYSLFAGYLTAVYNSVFTVCWLLNSCLLIPWI